ncbi:MAG: hypothetical protein JWR90_3492 [Marmoricola sp.]|nr:hypothetical protein [Marmoricola sp.]
MRTAYRDLTHDVTTQASPESIASRPGLRRGFDASLAAFESAAELAHGVAAQAERDYLTGPGRTLSPGTK